MASCGAFCSFCGRCGKTVEKSFGGAKPAGVAPPGVSAGESGRTAGGKAALHERARAAEDDVPSGTKGE